MEYTHYIGIDPDVEKSGVAVLNKQTKCLELHSLSFTELLNLFITQKASGNPSVVIVEAGWLNQGNWHLRYYDNIKVAARKGYDVGRNHEAGAKIIEAARYFNFEVRGVRPLKKCWRGKDGKITAEELAVFTGYTKKSNQDARDAGLLAWTGANLPIIMNPHLLKTLKIK